MHVLLRSLVLALVVAASSRVDACPPPAVFVPWKQQVATAYDRADIVFAAQVVREETHEGQDSAIVRYYLKPLVFYKGGSSRALAFIEKQLNFPCDQRPFAQVGQSALIFAREGVELLRATPWQDGAATERPYSFARKYVQARSTRRQPQPGYGAVGTK